MTLGTVNTVEEFVDSLSSEKGSKLLHYTVGDKHHELKYEKIKVGKKTHLAFYDEKLAKQCTESNQWNTDATYKAVPKLGTKMQLLTIMGNKYGKVYT